MSDVPATQAELNKFVKVVDEFMAKYAVLISPATRNDVYASNNAELISDYETAVSRGGILKSTIEATVGAWNAFKSGYKTVTDQTSLWIGDAIDSIRGIFGFGPVADMAGLTRGIYSGGLGALAAIQIPAAVWIAGIIASATVLISMMNKVFVSIEASKIQRQNPNISRADALRQAESGLPSFLPGGISLPMIAAGALALWLLWGKRK